jgi:hypothetical protein
VRGVLDGRERGDVIGLSGRQIDQYTDAQHPRRIRDQSASLIAMAAFTSSFHTQPGLTDSRSAGQHDQPRRIWRSLKSH